MLQLVETQTNDHSAPMLWVLPNLSIADLISEFEELKENYGLTMLRLGYSITLGESTISRIFSYKHTPNKSTLIALWLALQEWKKFYEEQEREVR